MKYRKIKVVEGEIVEEALTITERQKSEPEIQHLSRQKKQRLTPEQQETANRLMQHIDTKDLEQRLLNTYAGGFIGFSFEEENDE